MTDEAMPPDDTGRSDTRGLWISLGALISALALGGLIFMIALSSRDRDEALQYERRAAQVMLLSRGVDASIARAEAALGRYVLDERRETGTAFTLEWRLASWQIEQLRRRVRGDAEQRARVERLRALYAQRTSELAPAARAAERGQGTGGIAILYQASLTPTLPALRGTLVDIVEAEQVRLRERTAVTQGFVTRADALVEWLGWLAFLIGLAAVGLAWMAYRALREGQQAREEADLESWRASELERAVAARTGELSTAYERLQAETQERTAAEEKLRQVQKMEAVGQLTGGIAHDFNNMLAVVVGGLDLARRKIDGSRNELASHIDNAMEGATRAAALTRRLLAFARAEPLLPEGVAPARLVKGMLELIDRSIGERIKVTTRLPETDWHVYADPTQLENAILNLCVNARDAIEGDGEIKVDVGNVALAANAIDGLPAGDYVRVAVSDTGSGIAPEHIERVFEPFFTTKPVGKGTGLGLSQIFGFARQSNGSVTIESEPGRGTSVAIYLPRSIAAGSASAQAAPAEPAELTPRRTGTLVLVVEDDPRVSRATVAALKELGYTPLAVDGGREALNMLDDRADIPLIISDVMMPEMTGPELAREVARKHPDVRLLFVTGYVGEAGDADEFSGYEMLRKPFTVNALARAVARVMDAPETRASAAAE